MSNSYDDYPEALRQSHIINELIIVAEHNGRVLTEVVKALEIAITRIEELEKKI